LGKVLMFQQMASALIATFTEFGVGRIVTCDPHAYNTLRNEYPAFGGHYEVMHHTQLIARLVDAHRITLRPQFERIIYHDPCYLGRHNGEFAAPRSLLSRLSKDVPLEFELAREKAMCCGAGGGRMWMEDGAGKRINVLRVEQGLAESPSVIATGCPYCALMISDGLKALGKDEAIATRDVAELVAMSMV
jgi:Fe-S oxidoreductase